MQIQNKLHQTIIWVLLLQLINFGLWFIIGKNHPMQLIVDEFSGAKLIDFPKLNIALILIIIWIILYFFLGIFGSFLWQRKSDLKIKKLLRLFILQLLCLWLSQLLFISVIKPIMFTLSDINTKVAQVFMVILYIISMVGCPISLLVSIIVPILIMRKAYKNNFSRLEHTMIIFLMISCLLFSALSILFFLGALIRH